MGSKLKPLLFMQMTTYKEGKIVVARYLLKVEMLLTETNFKRF